MNDNNNRTHVYRIFVKATAQAIWGAPRLEAMVDGKHENAGGGWWETLSDLKSLLETGAPLRG